MDITLRKIEHSDAPAIVPLADDYELAKMVASIPVPYTLSDAEAFVEKVRRRHELGEGTDHVILVNGSVAGVVGNFRNENGECEIGYWIGRKYWGKGIGTEALRQKIKIIRADYDPEYLVARVMEENPASAAILIKAGFTLVEGKEESCASIARDGEVMSAIRYEYRWM